MRGVTKFSFYVAFSIIAISLSHTTAQNASRNSNSSSAVRGNTTASMKKLKPVANKTLTGQTRTAATSNAGVNVTRRKEGVKNRTAEKSRPTTRKPITIHHPRAGVRQKMRKIRLHEGHLNASHKSSKKYEIHHDFDVYHSHSHDHYQKPHHKFGHHFFLNQFVYEMQTVRSCFYQYVKKGCTMIVLYQSLGYEPVTVYIADHNNEVVHENQLSKGGHFTLTSENGGTYKICMENYSWGAKKIFLSIRVESHRNSKVMLSNHHPIAHTMLGHIRNLEVEVRSISALLWQRKASIMTENVLVEEENSLIVWMTWAVVVVAIVTYILQVMEIHRIFREAESKKTFSMQGGQLKIGRKR